MLSSANGAGRSAARAARARIASSLSSSRYCDFQYARKACRGKNGSNAACTAAYGVGPDMSNSGVPSSRSGWSTSMPSSGSGPQCTAPTMATGRSCRTSGIPGAAGNVIVTMKVVTSVGAASA